MDIDLEAVAGGWTDGFAWTPYKDDIIKSKTAHLFKERPDIKQTEIKRLIDADTDNKKTDFERDASIVQYECVCGHDRFYAGTEGYETILKCIECGREESVHQG